MRLAAGLRLGPGRVTAFVGAGGKTSAIRQATAELAETHPVLATTTTRLGREQTEFGRHVIANSEAEWRAALAAMSVGVPMVVTGAGSEVDGKWQGVDPVWIDRTRQMVQDAGGLLMVEADGGRGRAIKAPAAHEPVIPSSADLVVVVAGAHAIGQPLSEEIAHRPHEVSQVTGLQIGDPIDAESVCKLLTAAAGGLKQVPERAEVRLLLTHIQPKRVQLAQQLASLSLRTGRIRALVAADLGADPLVSGVYGRVAAVVLAAGGSRRMQESKQLLMWRGIPLVRHAVNAAAAAGLSPIVVVAGSQAESVAAAVEATDSRVAVNRNWDQGQAGSVRLGLQAVADDVEAAVFLLADMPLVEPATIENLVLHHRASLAPIVAPERDGRYGNPVLFDRRTFSDLEKIKGDRGGRALYGDYTVHGVPAGDGAFFDIDSDRQWNEFRSQHGS